VIVPTLRVGMHCKTLCVQVDAERQSMRFHAERGNDQRRQPESSVSIAFDFALLHQWSKRHKTRLGCRPNVDDAQWVEGHGSRESAVRTWMSVRRGPTERRRSAGIRRSRTQPGAKRFWLLFHGPTFRLFTKVTRCKSGTVIRATKNNEYTPDLNASTPTKKTPTKNGQPKSPKMPCVLFL